MNNYNDNNNDNNNNNIIKVVLFANGIGSNPNTYRPDSDESQWWNRRDALVRCVTAFLYTGKSKTSSSGSNDNNNNQQNSHNNNCSKELIILFDEDWSYFSMIYTPPPPPPPQSQSQATKIIVPTEQNIIQLWNYSSQYPGIRIVQQNDSFGLSCLCCCCTTTTIQTNMSKNVAQPVKTMTINDIISKNITNPNRKVVKNIHDYHKSNHHSSYTTTNDNNNDKSNNNKRSLLEYLQSTCSLEFLRQHRLNSSFDSIIKKVNKNKLMDIKQKWDEEQEKSNNNIGKKRKLSSLSPSSKTSSIASETKSASTSTSDSNKILESILQQILQPQSKYIQQVIAVTLHESSDNELPCWDDDDIHSHSNPDHPNPIQICFFLGAVRDMYKSENRILRQVCNNSNSNSGHIPLLRIRLGPVSEFTSKILSVLAYHIAHNRLILAIQRHIARNQSSSLSIKQNKIISTTTTTTMSTITLTEPPTSTTLHFICHVPISSQSFTTDVKNRNIILWGMVRCTVTCLWRSKLAGEQYNNKNSKNCNDNNSQNRNSTTPRQSSSSTIPIINRLSLIFDNGTIILTFNQNDLVSDMAEQHHAAPSEYQILCMIQNKLNTINQQQQEINQKQVATPSISKMQHSLFYDIKTNQLQLPTIGIDFSKPNSQIIDDCYFYKSIINNDTISTNHSKVVSPTIAIFIPLISNNNNAHLSTSIDQSTIIQNLLWKACINQTPKKSKQQQLTVNENNFNNIIPGYQLIHIDDTCIDYEGVTITMIQHLAYQERLLPLLSLFS